MAYEQKEGQGSLFRNERKEKETHPDWKGEIKINGKLYWLSAWEKAGQRDVFFSLAIGDEKKPRGEVQQAPQRTATTRPATRQTAQPGADSDKPPF